jgi:hypothetical protein
VVDSEVLAVDRANRLSPTSITFTGKFPPLYRCISDHLRLCSDIQFNLRQRIRNEDMLKGRFMLKMWDTIERENASAPTKHAPAVLAYRHSCSYVHGGVWFQLRSDVNL